MKINYFLILLVTVFQLNIKIELLINSTKHKLKLKTMKKIIFGIFILSLIVSCSKDDTNGTLTDGSSLYSDSESSGDLSTSGTGNGEGQIEAGQITAGEWNDLNNWDFWNDLMQNQDYSQMQDYWTYDLTARISVLLKNQNSEILVDKTIELINSENQVVWKSKTDNFGNAELWAYQKNGEQISLTNLKIKIDEQLFEDIHDFSDGINNLVVNTVYQNSAKKIDIAFIVDATGSMSDELEYLKVELIDIIGKVQNQNSSAVINMASVFYRDTQDEYLTRISHFSQDIQQTIDFIRQQSAGGGGDFPEAVHTALNVAVNDLQWSLKATSRIIFLILDAPPHYESQIVSEIHNLIYSASEKGIKIIPVVASGIDKETEFLMRYFSIATNGTYVFITNDSGIGNEHLDPSVGEYEVEFLNDLLERLINKYLE